MYTAKIDELMNLVNNFSQNYRTSPTNGIGFTTAPFKANFSDSLRETFIFLYGKQSEDVYEQYLKISEKSHDFSELLKEYVNSDNFIDNWNKLSKKEKDKIIFFDNDSYIILRSKLPSNELIFLDWDISISSIKWNDKFQDILGLSEDFKLPPQNKTQIFKQTKALLNMGFNDEQITDVYKDLDNNLMAQKIFNLVIKNKNTNVIPLIEKLDGYVHPSQTSLIFFIQQQEFLLLKNTNKLKM